MKNEWNITDNEGKELIIKVFTYILQNRTNVNEHELCIRMSTETNYNNIYILKNGKRRNLNNLMKIKFNGLHSFLKETENIFSYNNGIIRLK